jgi:hypothetical protein
MIIIRMSKMMWMDVDDSDNDDFCDEDEIDTMMI